MSSSEDKLASALKRRNATRLTAWRIIKAWERTYGSKNNASEWLDQLKGHLNSNNHNYFITVNGDNYFLGSRYE